MKNLAHASAEEQQEFLNSFDQILCDVDGVLWLLTHRIPDTEHGINALRRINKKIIFVSNNSSKAPEAYRKALEVSGFNPGDSLVTPIPAIVDHLQELNFTKEAFVIGMSSLRQALTNAGIKVADAGPDRIEETIHAVVENIQDNENVGAVIVDIDINLNFIKMQKAATYLKRPDVIFIAGASDARAPIGPDVILVGPKYVIRAVEEVTNRTAYSISKPSPNFNKYIVKKFDIQDPSRVLFIGDSVSEDMAFATNCGYKKLLVLTGLTKEASLKTWSWPEEWQPDYYIDSVATMRTIIDNLCL